MPGHLILFRWTFCMIPNVEFNREFLPVATIFLNKDLLGANKHVISMRKLRAAYLNLKHEYLKDEYIKAIRNG